MRRHRFFSTIHAEKFLFVHEIFWTNNKLKKVSTHIIQLTNYYKKISRLNESSHDEPTFEEEISSVLDYYYCGD